MEKVYLAESSSGSLTLHIDILKMMKRPVIKDFNSLLNSESSNSIWLWAFFLLILKSSLENA
jgi:hypothetical protein